MYPVLFADGVIPDTMYPVLFADGIIPDTIRIPEVLVSKSIVNMI